jgi:predicted oxidoreductase (fatty acid repression mutant protein)
MTQLTEILQKRRSVYALNCNLPVSEEAVIDLVKKVTELVPDAFNMKSQRVIIALGDKQDALWDGIYDAFGGKVAREKIDSFKAAYGTILYFIDDNTVKALQEKFPSYAENFPVWAQQANGMLQINIWAGLAELGVGANIQHYNPVIDHLVKDMFQVPDGYRLIAQMPFGSVESEREPKEKEDISVRVTIAR